MPSPIPNPNARLLLFLQATPEQQAAIDAILEGKLPAPQPVPTGPLLLPMGKAASLLGVSRPTLWRMLNARRLTRVEVLPNTYRVRRAEIEALVNGGPMQ
jgi:excisionase family DNA binding protein